MRWVCFAIMWSLKTRIEKSFSYSISYSYSNLKVPNCYHASSHYIVIILNPACIFTLIPHPASRILHPAARQTCLYRELMMGLRQPRSQGLSSLSRPWLRLVTCQAVTQTQILGGHVTSRNQGLSSNDQGRQRRETLGTRLGLRPRSHHAGEI